MHLFDPTLLNALNRWMKAGQPSDKLASISMSMLIVSSEGSIDSSVEWAHPSRIAEPKGRIDEEPSKKRSQSVSANPIA
jgi:hypothetical protein